MDTEEKVTTIISVCELEDKDLHSDPNSPWIHAPEAVKNLFVRDDHKKITVKEINHGFEPKPGQVNMCTRFFPSGGQYYTCTECCHNTFGTTMCYCESCWQEDKHVGHSFQVQTAWGSTAFCDCGRQSRIKPESFCSSHRFAGDIELKIDEEDRTKFITYFEPIFHIYFYMSVNEYSSTSDLQKNLNKAIQELCEGSLHYIRLTTQILDKMIKVRDEEVLALKFFVESNDNSEQMLFRMIADEVFKFKLTKVFISLQEDGWDSSSFRQLENEFFQNSSMLIKLAKIDIFTDKNNEKYHDAAAKSEEGKQALQKYLQYKKKNAKSTSEFIQFLLDFLNVKKSMDLFTNDDSLSRTILQMLIDSYEDSEEYKAINENDGLCRNRALTILQIFTGIFEGDYEKLKNVRESLPKLNITEDKFELFLLNAMKVSKGIIYRSDDKKQYMISTLLIMSLKSPKRQQLIEQFWKSVTKQNDGLRQDFIETVDVIYHCTAIICHQDTFFSSYSKNAKIDEKSEKQKEAWFKSLLYENNTTDKDELIKMRNEGQLKFKNAGPILREYCRYQQNTDDFIYTSTEKHPNYAMKFKVRSRRGNFRNISHSHFSLEEKIDVESEAHQEIFDMIYNNPNFMATFSVIWWKKVKENKDNDGVTGFWKNYELGYFYVLILVISLHLTNGKNEEVAKEIERIRSDDEIVNQLSSYNSSPEILKRLLSIKPKSKKQSPKKEDKNAEEKSKKREGQEESQQEEEKIEKKQESVDHETEEQAKIEIEKKKKFLAKKEKMKNKYSKIHELVLQKNPSKTSAIEEVEEQNEQCLLCHETCKKDKKMVYLASLDKDNTIATSFHGSEDKARIMLETCFHAVHSKCFLNIDKSSGMDYTCPLCSKKRNIILPIVSAYKVAHRQCENVMNALHVVKYKSLDFDNIFPYYFFHLVESYGLSSLISIARFEMERNYRRRVDQYILELASNMFENFTEAEKAEALSAYQNFLTEVNKCSNSLIQDIQVLLANVIFQKICNGVGSYDEKKLLEIKNKMIEEEFNIIKQSIEDLVEYQVILPEAMEEKETEKISLSFKIKDLPKKSSDLKNFGSEICSKCEKQNKKAICLLCGKTFCGNCDGLNTHKQEHNNNYILFYFSNGKVSLQRSSNRISNSVYYNAFMQSYQQKGKDDDLDDFELVSSKFEKIAEAFFLKS